MDELEKVVAFDNDVLNIFSKAEQFSRDNGIDYIDAFSMFYSLLTVQDSSLYNALSEFSFNKDFYTELKQKSSDYLKQIKEKPETFIYNINNLLLEDGLTKKYSLETHALKFDIDLHDFVIELLNCDEYQEYQGKKVKEYIDNSLMVQMYLAYLPEKVEEMLKEAGVNIAAVDEYVTSMRVPLWYTFQNDENDIESFKNLEQEIKDAQIDGFVTDISSKYIGKEKCEYLGRDKEITRVMKTLQKRGKKNVILVGEPGVGKTAIAEKIAFNIVTGNCPESLKGYTVLQVDITNVIAGTTLRGQAEEKFKSLSEFLESHDNVIIFIDEIHTIIGAGTSKGNESDDMANALKPFLASSKSRFIGATTDEEYEKYIKCDPAFKRRFEKVVIKEPKSTELFDMLKNSIEAHQEYHGVKISREIFDYTVLIASCFESTTHNPDRTNDLIDRSMVNAKEKGKAEIDKDDVLENFDINFDKFNNMEEMEKKSTAYHEAGHYLINRMSEKLKDFKGIAVSIMPAEEYLGITIYDDISDEVTVYKDRTYYIDYIARILAGRIAEKRYTKTISAGACSDLEKANKLAYNVVTGMGLSKDDNRVYFESDDYHLMSEKIRDKIDEEVSLIINEATKRAETLINENEGYLLKLVDLLMEKGILDESQLNKIFD